MTLPMDVLLLPKSQCWPMRLLGRVLGRSFMDDFWTTYRLPFGRCVIAYPDRARDPEMQEDILLHELVHVRQFRPWYGPLVVGLLASVLPLPVLLSGRWYIERRAYLEDIRCGLLTVDQAVEVLWSGYGWCWPRSWMARWFGRMLADG